MIDPLSGIELQRIPSFETLVFYKFSKFRIVKLPGKWKLYHENNLLSMFEVKTAKIIKYISFSPCLSSKNEEISEGK